MRPPNNPSNTLPRAVGMFRLAGTRSFRLSCGQLFEFGANLQNPPKPLLSCLIPRPGHSFVQPDQAGAEALCVANVTRPGAYRALFANKIKPHTFLALHIFGKQRPQWFEDTDTPGQVFLDTLDPAKLSQLPGWPSVNKHITASDNPDIDKSRPYYVGKRTAHARSYRMGWKTFQLALLKDTAGTMVLDAATAKVFLGMFDKLFPEIIEWQAEVVALAQAKGELRNLFNYPRRCDRVFTHSYERELISWIPQSTVGCITHKCVNTTQRYITAHSKQWNILNNKHDSVVCEVPDADVNECARTMTQAMAITMVGRDGVEFTMKSDVQVGKNWASYHPDKNPVGMRGYTITE